ncbi:MAG: hypothetical protein CSA25_00715 [Desulfobacter postgatei]|uniref:Uncharacterized protein n=1 Tax=Desulfobacter postgatei TaxID=2293 RepID=A0A2G6MTC3_9BACT|nr:MAG: hypothetical protein CSA25_00715 [Desulfobacter postgatei]
MPNNMPADEKYDIFSIKPLIFSNLFKIINLNLQSYLLVLAFLVQEGFNMIIFLLKEYLFLTRFHMGFRML